MGAVSVCHCDKNLENLEEEGYISATVSGHSVAHSGGDSFYFTVLRVSFVMIMC